MPPKSRQAAPKEVSQPMVIGIIAVVVVAVAIFGWLQLRTPTPNVTPEQTKKGVDRQMQGMMDAMKSMGAKPK